MSENLGYVAPGEKIGVGTPPPKPGTPTGGTKKKKSGGTSAPVETPVEETEPVELGPATKELITDDGTVPAPDVDPGVLPDEPGTGTGTGTGTVTGTGTGTGTGGKTLITDGTPGTGTGLTPGTGADDTAQALTDRARLLAALTEGYGEADIDRVDYYDKQPLVDLLDQRTALATEQTNATIDRAVDQEALDLQRALADADQMYATEQNNITADELNALDNAALYVEARGDRGGIGAAQYNEIQNTAAQNRLAVQNAQTKLSTDTMRQIGDLRAQGEFDKADALLSLTQSYLAELTNIEQYAASHNLSVDQLNTSIAEWEAEFNANAQKFITSTEMSLANMTGEFSDGTPTYQAEQATKENMANLALTMLQQGGKVDSLSEAMKKALEEVFGLDADSLAAYAKLVKPKSSSSRPRGGSSSTNNADPDLADALNVNLDAGTSESTSGNTSGSTSMNITLPTPTQARELTNSQLNRFSNGDFSTPWYKG